MLRLFDLVQASEHQTSCSQAQVIVQTYQERLLTGLVAISQLSQYRSALLLAEGNIVNGYQHTSGAWQRTKAGDWGSDLGRGDCQMRILPLPPDGIRFAKSFFECTGAAQSSSIPSSQVPHLLQEWLTLPDMTVASLQWDSAQGMIIFPGKGASPTPILFASRDHIATGVEALETILWHSESPCSARFCTNQECTQASQEYFLSQAFVTAADRLLARYTELAGRSLSALLAQEINALTRLQGWQINVMGEHVHDGGIFSSPEEAASAYRAILEVCIRHIRAAIGTPLTQAVLHQLADRLSISSHRLLQNYQVFPPAEQEI